MKQNSKVDLSNYERAVKLMLIAPRNIKVVKISSFLKNKNSYSLDLVDSIMYSMSTPPAFRYYYCWIKQSYPNLDLERIAFYVKQRPFFIDYKELYNEDYCHRYPTLTAIRKEIVLIIQNKGIYV